jgi:PmbA protein
MKRFAERTVKEGLSGGAETVEVFVSESSEFEVRVRNGEIETLTESDSSTVSITVSLDKRMASVQSSDLSGEGVARLIRDAVELAGVMDRDEYFDLPDYEELGGVDEYLGIFDPETVRMPTGDKIAVARELEKKARDLDERIISDGASFSNEVKTIVLANSKDFCNGYRRTLSSIDVSCAAEDRPADGLNIGKKQSSFWFSTATHLGDLESTDDVASRAVSRTLQKLGAVKPKTCEVPVVLDQTTASSFLTNIASAVNGGHIYRNSSFLVDMIGSPIGSELVTIVDDPLITGKMGSRPFDAEGVRSRTNVVVEKGVLKSYLMSTYSAKKLELKTTGNAGGTSNFYVKPGPYDPEEIVSSIEEGLYLTSLSGPGANWTTGDFSQGGQGMWIENGRLSYPVNEFTVAGTFMDILKGIVMIGNDLEWRKPLASPTLKIDRMIVSGT